MSPRQYTRREFLKAVGGSSLFLVTYGCGLTDLLSFRGKASLPLVPGSEEWIPSLCGQCPGGCGLLAKVVEGKVKGVKGNPLHPINRGGLCARGLSAPITLYDPDRIRGPLKRTGARGEGRFEPIGWEEAVQTITSKLKELKEKGQAHTVGLLDGHYQGLMKILWQRFLESYGSPNHFDGRSPQEKGPTGALYAMQGISGGISLDLSETAFLLSFNSGLLESSASLVQIAQAYGKMRRSESGRRGRMVHIEPRFSITASKADEWIPIQPNTEGALALGIASVILQEGLFDAEFITQHTFGFEDWTDAEGMSHTGFKTMVLKDYPVSKCAAITGVSIGTIVKLAREFALLKPAIAVGGWDKGQDVYTQMAIHSLNALVGSLDVPGGVLSPREFVHNLPPFENSVSKQTPRFDPGGENEFPLSLTTTELLADKIIGGNPYPLNLLFLYEADPVFTNPQGESFGRALLKIPFVISFSSFRNQTTQFADLILPDHTFLEKWTDHTGLTTRGFPVVSVGKPVVAPFYDTRQVGDVLLEVAGLLSEKTSKALPWKDFPEMLKQAFEHIFDFKRGDLFGSKYEEFWTQFLEASGWIASGAPSFDTFWKGVLEKGGWSDPVYFLGEWQQVFKTPSKKFEFYSNLLAQASQKRNITSLPSFLKGKEAYTLQSEGDVLFMPHYEEIQIDGTQEEYPYFVYPFPLATHSLLTSFNQPLLQDISGFTVYSRWETWAEIHPETAKKHHIDHDDWIWVESETSKIKVRAKLFEGLMPQIIAIPMGMGDQGQGRWTHSIGENVFLLRKPKVDPLTGALVGSVGRVRIYKG